MVVKEKKQASSPRPAVAPSPTPEPVPAPGGVTAVPSVADDVAAVILQHPNVFGNLEPVRAVIEIDFHEKRMLAAAIIAMNVDFVCRHGALFIANLA